MTHHDHIHRLSTASITSNTDSVFSRSSNLTTPCESPIEPHVYSNSKPAESKQFAHPAEVDHTVRHTLAELDVAARSADGARDVRGPALFVITPDHGKSIRLGLEAMVQPAHSSSTGSSHIDPTMSRTVEINSTAPINTPTQGHGTRDGHGLSHTHHLHPDDQASRDATPVHQTLSPGNPHLLDSMSLVSPPFTPSQSTIDLVHPGDSSHGLTGGLPPVAPSSSSHDGSVRRELGELPVVFCESRARIPTTSGGEFFLHVYSNNVDNKEHLAIVFSADIHSKTLFDVRPGETERDRMIRGAYSGKLRPGRSTSAAEDEEGAEATDKQQEQQHPKDTLVRIHSECYTGETAWSARCDCGEQLDEAARLMALEGRGVIVYLRQEGRGIGLGEKLKAYNLQDLGADTVQANLMLRHPADARSFGMATAILKDLGLDHVRLLTNNPDKIVAVEGKNHEVTVTERVPMVPLSWQNKGGFRSKEVDKYLETKVERMGHMLDFTGRH